jgi:cation transport ATPase
MWLLPRVSPTGGMDTNQLPVLAGSLATTIFVGSYLPMLVRAIRTRDLSSYSRSSLVMANVGNLVQTAYVVTLPVGPIWGLHAFYLVATVVMLLLHVRHASERAAQSRAAKSLAAQSRAAETPRLAQPTALHSQQPSPERVSLMAAS